jgi:hypothetical protein
MRHFLNFCWRYLVQDVSLGFSRPFNSELSLRSNKCLLVIRLKKKSSGAVINIIISKSSTVKQANAKVCELRL